MKKLFLLPAVALFGLVGCGQQPAAPAGPTGPTSYKLDGTVVQTDNDAHDGSNYSKSLPVTMDEVTWDVVGNTTMNPWRIGGKASNIGTPTDRLVNTKAAFTKFAVSKVTVELGDIFDGLTFSKLTLKVGTTEGGEETSKLEETTLASQATIEFVKPANADWSGKFFTLAFTVSTDQTSNKAVQLKAVNLLA